MAIPPKSKSKEAPVSDICTCINCCNILISSEQKADGTIPGIACWKTTAGEQGNLVIVLGILGVDTLVINS